MRKVIIMNKKEDKFTKSECDCNFCKETEEVNKKWNDYEVTNNLQKRMKEVINKIENK